MNAKLLRAATILSALSVLGYLSLAPSRLQGADANPCGEHGQQVNGACVCEANFTFVDGVCKAVGGTGSGDGTGSVGNTGGGRDGGTGGENRGGGNVPGTTTPTGSGRGGRDGGGRGGGDRNTPAGAPAGAAGGQGDKGGGCCG